jgi:hypothetical protein
MRMGGRLSVLALPLAGAVACTAILGDFNVSSSGGGGDDGGGLGDAPVAIAEGGEEGATDSPSGDAAGNAVSQDDSGNSSLGDASDGSTLRKLRCASPTTGGSRVQVTTGNSVNADFIRVASIGQNQVRIVAVDYPNQEAGGNNPAWLRTYTLSSSGGGNVGIASLPTNSGQVFALERYSGTPSGFVALYGVPDPITMSNNLVVARLPDDSNTWVGPQVLAAIPSNLQNAQVALSVINAAQDDYYVALSTISGSMQNVYAGEVNPGLGTLAVAASYPTMSNGGSAYQLTAPGIAMSGAQAYILLSPNGQNGPPALGAPAAMLIPGAAKPTVLITPPSNLNYFPFGLTSATAPEFANVLFLVADLTQLRGTYRAGQVATNTLASLDPMSLPSTIPTTATGGATIKDLIINSPTIHWETASGAEQLLVLAPPADLAMGYPGVNFAWWDAQTGTLRALATGDGAMLADVPNVHRADATFASLVGSIVQLWVAYESTQVSASMNNSPPPPSDIWLGRLTCTL